MWSGQFPGYSTRPVRYSNGEIRLITNDIVSNAFGEDWGHTRSYSNQLASNYDGPNGVNWFIKEAPVLMIQDPSPTNPNQGTIIIVGIVNDTLWFDWDGTAYVPRFFVKDTLTLSGMKFIHRIPRENGRSFTILQ